MGNEAARDRSEEVRHPRLEVQVRHPDRRLQLRGSSPLPSCTYFMRPFELCERARRGSPLFPGQTLTDNSSPLAQRAEFTVLTNDSLPGFLEKPRPEFAKVRWMHVNGLSWDVIKALALHYNLHPLSLEDMLHSSSSASTRSKVDYFRHHLFASIIVHRTLEPTGGQDVKSAQEETLGITKTTTKTLKNGSKGRGAQLRTQ